MAIYKNTPPIVTNGLVLALDAANTKSYVSGSVIWGNLVNPLLSGSLINGPTFNNQNGGSIVFDGTNDYGVVNSVNLSGTNKITIDIWMKFTSTSTQIIGEHSINFNGANAFLIDINELGGVGSFQISQYNSGYNIAYTSVGFNDGRWHNFTTIINRSLVATQEIQIYADTTLNTTYSPIYQTDITGNFSTFDFYIGSRAGSSYFYNGNIANFKIYNRALSNSEILQNYNATKGRFGLWYTEHLP